MTGSLQNSFYKYDFRQAFYDKSANPNGKARPVLFCTDIRIGFSSETSKANDWGLLLSYAWTDWNNFKSNSFNGAQFRMGIIAGLNR